MKITSGNIWEFKDGYTIIPTNGYVNNQGKCVMSRGVALQATQRYPYIARQVGIKIAAKGNHVYFFPAENLITFPVKHVWNEMADLKLIQRSVKELLDNPIVKLNKDFKAYLPRVGCGNGGLKWEIVKPLLEPLDNRFTLVNWEFV